MSDTNPMPAFLADDAFDGGMSARGESRDSLFLLAEVQAQGWPAPLKVKIRNLSAGGLLAESPHRVPEGTVLTVKLPNLSPIVSRCVWSGENRFGIAFDHEIDPQAVRRKVGSRTDVPATLIGMTLHTSKYKKPLRPV
jgi:hypothetical protein